MSYGKDSDSTCRFCVWGQSFRIKYPFQSHFLSLPQPYSWPPQVLEDGEMGPTRARQGSTGMREELRAGAGSGEGPGLRWSYLLPRLPFLAPPVHLAPCWMLYIHYRRPCWWPTPTLAVPFCRKRNLSSQSHLHKVIQLTDVFSFIQQIRTRHPQWMRCSSHLWK